jgi:uncharacterized alkaline shock family protein YloU
VSIELPGDGGALRVATAAVAQIVAQAAESVEGVRVRKPRRRIDVSLDDGRARVTLSLSLTYGSVIPDAARAVQERVGAAVGQMCGCDVEAVDVAVEGLDE